MTNTFFTSDHHFGHKNILEYEKQHRPFASVEEMNEALIDKWNSVVTRNDIVYYLGDFCFGRENIAIADRLNGKKRLILGNHDVYPIDEYLKYFDKVFGCLFYKTCILTHIPVHPNHARAMINIHGHLHSKVTDREMRNQPLYVNVSVEQTDLTPISFEEVQLRAYRSFD
jgi:calcineurin-like phosphoesterase family protein